MTRIHDEREALDLDQRARRAEGGYLADCDYGYDRRDPRRAHEIAVQARWLRRLRLARQIADVAIAAGLLALFVWWVR